MSLERGEDSLLRPHKKSQIPGYLGYTPQYKFHCGHTYGYHTDKLDKKQARPILFRGSYAHPSNPHTQKFQNLVSVGDGNRKYFQQMVPGYTGFVPRLQTKFGSRYRESTEDAVQEFNSDVCQKREDLNQMDNYVRTARQMNVKEDYPLPNPSHPGIDLRYATAERSRLFADRRAETEPPIVGYQGHIPRQIEHYVGHRYSTWSERALRDASNQRLKRMMNNTRDVVLDHQPPTFINSSTQYSRPFTAAPVTNPSQWSRYGSVYDKKGMIPKYTGYVPQLTFSLGNTYGDGTRSMPACHDINGYAAGKYNGRGEIMDRLTIKA